jgi:hypothetical protein
MSGTTLHDDGFTRLPGLIHPRELGALQAGVEAKLREPLPVGCERPHNTLAPLRWSDQPVLSVLGRQELTERVAAASGASDLRWISGYVSVKDGLSAPLGWHQDWWCWSHPVSYGERAPQIAVLCYLADTDTHSGALRVLAGTHRRSSEFHRVLADGADQHDLAHTDHPDQLTLTARVGDAVVIDYRLLHGTHANRTSGRRDCLILNFTPHWSELPDDVRAHLIRHPALPQAGETPPGALDRLLPHYAGTPRDLELARAAPAEFAIGSPV